MAIVYQYLQLPTSLRFTRSFTVFCDRMRSGSWEKSNTSAAKVTQRPLILIPRTIPNTSTNEHLHSGVCFALWDHVNLLVFILFLTTGSSNWLSYYRWEFGLENKTLCIFSKGCKQGTFFFLDNESWLAAVVEAGADIKNIRKTL